MGLAALAGVVNSEVLYHTSSEFKTQVTIIVRPLLVTLLFTELSVLDQMYAYFINPGIDTITKIFFLDLLPSKTKCNHHT